MKLSEKTAEKKPINVLVIIPGMIASVTVGILLPLVELEKRGEVCLKLMYSGRLSFLIKWFIESWCDVVLFCRNSELKDLEYLRLAIRSNKKVVYEIDDNFFNIPLSTSLGRYHRKYYRLYVIKKFFSLSDLVRVYSTTLFNLARQYSDKVEIKSLYFFSDVLRNLPEPKRNNNVVKISYPTTRIDEPNLEDMIYAALRTVLIKYGDRVELHLWKKAPPKLLHGLSNVVLHKSSASYKQFLTEFYLSGYDIGLAPVMDHPFYHSKTNNKYREYAGCKVAAIYTNALPYKDCIRDGYNGLLSENTFDDWVSKISNLVENESLRQTIVDNAHDDIVKHYNFDKFVNVWKNDLDKVLASDRTQANEPAPINVSDIIICGGDEGPADPRVDYLYETASLSGLKCICIERLSFYDLATDRIAVFLANFDYLMYYVSDFAGCFSYMLLDLSQYKGNPETVINLYPSWTTFKFKILTSEYNIELNAKLANAGIPFDIVNVDVKSMYALSGYHAVYFNFLDEFVGEKRNFYAWMRRTKKFISKLYTIITRHLQIITTFVRWFFGGRSM